MERHDQHRMPGHHDSAELRVLLVKCSESADNDLRDWPKAPPLGIMYVSACLKAWLPFPVNTKLLAVNNNDDQRQAVREALRTFTPHIVGLSAVTAEFSTADALAQLAREELPGVLTVLGGPHATVHPESILGRPHFDLAVIGEGEQTMAEVAQAFWEGRGFNDIMGIACVDPEGRLVRTPPRPSLEDLDLLPFPDWEAMDLRPYHEHNNYVGFRNPSRRYMTVVTSRGCPYRCIYCHNIFGKKTRLRSARHVMAELTALYREHGITEFMIADDIFNLDHDRMMSLLDMIIASGMDIRLTFPNGLRADIMTHEEIDRLYEAGTYYAAFALEVGSRRMQTFIHKGLDLDKALDIVAYASAKGIIICCFFMVGFPTETVEEMRETLMLAAKPFIDLPVVFTAIPQHGTPLHRLAVEHGYPLENPDYDDFQYVASPINMSQATDRQFNEIRAMVPRIAGGARSAARLREKMDHWQVFFSARTSTHSHYQGAYPRVDCQELDELAQRRTVQQVFDRIDRAARLLNDRDSRCRLWSRPLPPFGMELGCRYQDHEEVLRLLPRNDDEPAFGRSRHLNLTRRAFSGDMPGSSPALTLLLGVVERIDGPFTPAET